MLTLRDAALPSAPDDHPVERYIGRSFISSAFEIVNSPSHGDFVIASINLVRPREIKASPDFRHKWQAFAVGGGPDEASEKSGKLNYL